MQTPEEEIKMHSRVLETQEKGQNPSPTGSRAGHRGKKPTTLNARC